MDSSSPVTTSTQTPASQSQKQDSAQNQKTSSPWFSMEINSENETTLVSDVQVVDGVAKTSMPSDLLKNAQPLWCNFVVGYFIGDAPHIGKVHATVNRIWTNQAKTSKIDVQFLNPKTVLFRIEDPVMCTRVLKRHIWHISDIPLVMQEWSPKTASMKPDLSSMPIWVDFKDVIDQLFSEKGMFFLRDIIVMVPDLEPLT